MTNTEHTIRILQGAGFPSEPEPEAPVAHPMLLLVLLIATGWAAAMGVAYAAYRAVEALAG